MEDRNREEKIEGGEILFEKTPRQEKKHGKIYRFLDNFWYHHKWATIAVIFLLAIAVSVVVTMCRREDEGDLSVTMALPLGFADREGEFRDLETCLSSYLPEDYDKNGRKSVKIITYTVFSEEEIAAMESAEAIGLQENATQYQNFYRYLGVGEAGVLFLSPYLFEELSANEGYLVNLAETLGSTPVGGIEKIYGGERHVICGVRLGDTALYRENSAVRCLPEDTVVALLAPLTIGKNSKPEEYAKSVAFLRALVEK